MSESEPLIKLKGLNQSLSLIDDLQFGIENPQETLIGVANLYQRSIRQSFEQQRSPGGKPWQKLAPGTIKARKAKGLWNGQILEATGDGRKSIRVILAANNVRIEYSAVMALHQEGSNRLSQRQFAPTAQDFVSGPFSVALEKVLLQGLRTISLGNSEEGLF